jgi:hypothetical protein
MGQDDPLLSPFPQWKKLGQTEAERRKRWRAKVRAVQDETELDSVRRSLQSGRPFGAADWTDRIARRLGIDLNPRPRGRPRRENRSDTECRLGLWITQPWDAIAVVLCVRRTLRELETTRPR